MKTFLSILVVPLLVIHADAASTPPSPEERAKEIARLETQKSELFEQLNAAINDSLRSLRANNDSEAAVGIGYIEDLREQVKALNASPSQLTNERVQMQDDEIMDEEPGAEGFRRKADALRQLNVPTMKPSETKYFNVDIFSNKAQESAKWKKRYDNRMIMQQRLDDWLVQREKEKSEIKLYKTAQAKLEKCPPRGASKNKKKKDTRRSGGDRLAKYPCCRKCCKQSYLGCL